MAKYKQSTCINCGNIIFQLNTSWSSWRHYESDWEPADDGFTYCANVGKPKSSSEADRQGKPWVSSGRSAMPGSNPIFETDHIVTDVALPTAASIPINENDLAKINSGHVVDVKKGYRVRTLIEAIHQQVSRSSTSSFLVVMKTGYLAKKFDVEYALEYPDDTLADIQVISKSNLHTSTVGKHFDFVYVLGWDTFSLHDTWMLEKTTLENIRGIA